VSFVVVPAEHCNLTEASRLTTLYKTTYTLRNPGRLFRGSIESMPFNTATLFVSLLFVVCSGKMHPRLVRPGVIATLEHLVRSPLQRW
jgi:hypothetical protein